MGGVDRTCPLPGGRTDSLGPTSAASATHPRPSFEIWRKSKGRSAGETLSTARYRCCWSEATTVQRAAAYAAQGGWTLASHGRAEILRSVRALPLVTRSRRSRLSCGAGNSARTSRWLTRLAQLLFPRFANRLYGAPEEALDNNRSKNRGQCRSQTKPCKNRN
jgi:hypothetical protein